MFLEFYNYSNFDNVCWKKIFISFKFLGGVDIGFGKIKKCYKYMCNIILVEEWFWKINEF